MGVSSSKHSTGMPSCCKSYFASFSVLSRTFYTEICNVALHKSILLWADQIPLMISCFLILSI